MASRSAAARFLERGLGDCPAAEHLLDLRASLGEHCHEGLMDAADLLGRQDASSDLRLVGADGHLVPSTVQRRDGFWYAFYELDLFRHLDVRRPIDDNDAVAIQ